jgi:hypothetical protein
VFAPISAIFGFFFFASTLPNGIRVDELPPGTDSVEIVAGYAAGGLTGLESTAAATALFRDAYAAGGDIQFINEIDRTALRIVAPAWAAPMLFARLPALFKEVPGENGDRDRRPMSPDFRAKVEDEIRDALLGAGASEPDYGTGDAFVLSSTPAPKSLLDALAAIPRRGSRNKPQEQLTRLVAERTLRFKSDLPTGAVIFAAPAPAVYYQQWYLLLLIDKLIHRVIRLPLQTSLPLNVRPYYYRIELPLGAGQFPEPAETNLLQELERLQFMPANPRDLSAARQDAVAYLDGKDVREWFASHGISDRRDEGVHWLESMTADDMRATARDLLIMNRVVASWAPRPKETTVSVEPLSSSSPQPSVGVRREPDKPKPTENDENVTAFPAHTEPPASTSVAERLPSGVFLAPSNVNAVFVSGGALTRFNHDPSPDDLKGFSSYRAERILVFAPAASLARARQVWSDFKGSTTGPTGVPKGKVSTGDLPALFILEALLDIKVIESGWWRDVHLRIDATEGSSLQIVADDEKRQQILDWIKAIGMAPPSEKYFNWVREVAVHRFWMAMPDLQALTWERDPQGAVSDLTTVTPQLVQDVARIYF